MKAIYIYIYILHPKYIVEAILLLWVDALLPIHLYCSNLSNGVNLGVSNHGSTLVTHHRTLAASAQVILLLEMLKFSEIIYLEE